MATASDFGSWHEDGSAGETSIPASTRRDKHANAREPAADRAGRIPPDQRRPASATTTVRVPYLPAHVRIYPLRAKRRPRSAASSYMRSTFAIDSALSARATPPTTQHRQQRRQRLLLGRASWQVEKRRSDEAKYVLQEDAGQNVNSNLGLSTVPHARRGFGVRTRTATTGKGGVGSGGKRCWAGDAHHRNIRPDRCSSTRPASAPTRFYDRRPSTSPACERAAGSEPIDRCRGTAPRRAPRLRPASALARIPTNRTHGHNILQTRTAIERRRGSPLPPPAWGVRLASASSEATGGVAEAGGSFPQSERDFEEIVFCRGSNKVVTGSTTRRHKAGGFGSVDLDNGRHDKWVGLLEGSSVSKMWACGGGKKEDGSGEEGRAVPRATNVGDIAVSPSPWGAFVGRSSARSVYDGGKKRPSSAPRRRSTAGKFAKDGFGLCGDRVRARPRSAHAASASRDINDKGASAESYKGYSGGSRGGDGGGGDKRENGSTTTAEGGDVVTRLGERRSSRGVRLTQAHDERAPIAEDIACGIAPPRQAGVPGMSKDACNACNQESLTREAGLVVVARQLHPSTIVHPSTKRGEQQNASKRKAGSPAVHALRPRVVGEGPPDTDSPPSLAPSALSRAPPPPPPPLPSPSPGLEPSPQPSDRKFLGLFGSALVPAGGGAEPPQHWASVRRALQLRRRGQQERQPTNTNLAGEAKKNAGDGTAQHRSLSFEFAPVVLDRRLTNGPGGDNGNRRARSAGLAGTALRVPKRNNCRGQQQQHRSNPSPSSHGAPRSRGGGLAACLRGGQESSPSVPKR